MKVCMVRINKNGYKGQFLKSTKFFVVISLVLILASTYPGYVSAQRKYSAMSTNEAQQHVKMIIETRKVPELRGGFPFGSIPWKLPDVGPYACGLKLDDTEYIVWAAVGASALLEDTYLKGLHEFLPEATAKMTFNVNGILFSTVDIEVVNFPLFIKVSIEEENKTTWRWTRGNQVIGRGGYIWWIASFGICLDSSTTTLLIPFKELKDFNFKTIYLVKFSILQEANAGVILKVAGKDIQLK